MDSKDKPISIPPQDDLTEIRKPTSLLVAQFFLFPLIVIAFGVGIFVLFGSLAMDRKSPENYLAEIRSGGGYVFESRRWQAAFELANIIPAQRDELLESGFVEDLLATYISAKPAEDTIAAEQDWRLRQYLAFSMGELGSSRFVPALVGGLSDETADTRIYTLVSLGKIGDSGAGPDVAALLSDEDSGVRTMAAYVLGVLGNTDTLHNLRVALNDAAVDVRWNAAMSLAKMDDRSGADLLIELMNRSYLAQFEEMSDAQKNETIVNAIRSLALLKLERAREQIVVLSEDDPSVAVRGAALTALETF